MFFENIKTKNRISRFFLGFLTVFGLTIGSYPQKYSKAAGWYDVNWQFRKRITIDSTVINSNLTNFPVYVDLSDLGLDFFSNVDSAGSDIVITSSDGITKLQRELVSIDTGVGTENGQLWFLAPAIDSVLDTEYYIYYGNAAATETNDNIWTGYTVVNHMEEDPSSTLTDSSGSANTATGNGGLTSANSVAGQFGNAVNFDGVDDFISYPTQVITNIFGGTFSVSFWTQADTLADRPTFGFSGSTTLNEANPFASADNCLNFGDETLSQCDPAFLLNDASTTNFDYYTIVDDGTNYLVYRNGVLESSTAITVNPTASVNREFIFGQTGFDNPNENFFAGDLDEFRVSTTVKNLDWINTEYINQSSTTTFYSVGIAEGGNTPFVVSIDQMNSDCTTPINLGWGNSDPLDTDICLTANVSDPTGIDQVRLEVEVKDTATAFDGTGTTVGSYFPTSGSAINITTTVSGLSAGDYHWRARLMDDDGNFSDWYYFGSNIETDRDFMIRMPDPCPVTDGGPNDSDGNPANGSVALLNNMTWSATATNLGYFDCRGLDIIIGDGVSPTTLTLDSLSDTDTDYTEDYGVTLLIDSISVGLNSMISADIQGYPSASGPGRGLSKTSGNNTSGVGGSGAGYGGVGMSGGAGAGGDIYGDPLIPYLYLGSGGGAGKNGAGSPGGGGIQVIANGVFIEGTISSNGGDVSGRRGAGSGGSIKIKSRDFQSYSGSLFSARGGDVIPSSRATTSGAGGGGRIFIEYVNGSFDGEIDIRDGINYNTVDRRAENGTAIVKDLSDSDLYVYAKQRWVADPFAKSDTFETWFADIDDMFVDTQSPSQFSEENDAGDPSINVTDNAASLTINYTVANMIYLDSDLGIEKARYYVEVNDNESNNHTIWGYVGPNTFISPNNQFQIYKDINLTDRGWNGDTSNFVSSTPANWTYDFRQNTILNLDAINKTPIDPIADPIETWHIELNNLNIAEKSSLNLTGFGYGSASGPGRGLSKTSGNNTSGVGGSGAGYGGVGMSGGAGAGGDIYGNPILTDLDAGSGGGAGYSGAGSGGGGGIEIIANDILLYGEIASNGGDVSGRRGAGSGGGIKIQSTNMTAFESSIISAGGGNIWYSSSATTSGAGGGGRIFIEYVNGSFDGKIEARGGNNYNSGEHAEDGTAIVKDLSKADLYIYSTQRWVADPVAKSDTFETWFADIDDMFVLPSGLIHYSYVNDDGDPIIDLTGNTASFIVNDADNITYLDSNLWFEKARYYVEVNDNESNNHTIWGYVGPNTFISPNNQFQIYKDINLTDRGWNGDTSNFVSSTPANWTYDFARSAILNLDSSNKTSTDSISNPIENWSILLNSLSIDQKAGINLSGLGYSGGNNSHHQGYGLGGGYGTAYNNGNSTSGLGGGGGSYGGLGTYLTSDIYGNPIMLPFDAGSGGGSGYSGEGGAGGGGIEILLSQNLNLNGSILADGENIGGRRGAGSGGAIYIDVEGGFSGNSTSLISANGGDAVLSSVNNASTIGAGGGGRVYIEYDVNNYQGTIQSLAGINQHTGLAAENGTLVLVDEPNQYLYIPQTQRWVPEDAFSFETWFPNSDILHSDIENNSTLYLDSINKSPTDPIANPLIGWDIELENLNIESGSSINADYFGYSGGNGSHIGGYGPGGGTGNAGTDTEGGGGGHGGVGGTALGGIENDEYTFPVDAGSGGGAGRCDSTINGSSGGGLIKLTVNQDFILDGSISAKGKDGRSAQDATSWCGSGGGAGGTVNVVVNSLDTATDTGTLISTTGGTGGAAYNAGGAGGGGRISIYYTTINPRFLITNPNDPLTPYDTNGGLSPVGREGNFGSIYLDQNPTLSNPGQFLVDCSTAISVGGSVLETEDICFKSTVHDLDIPQDIHWELEIKPLGIAFDNTGKISSSTVDTYYDGNGEEMIVNIPVNAGTYSVGEYHWRARAVDQEGYISPWISFGGNLETEIDFVIGDPTFIQISIVDGNTHTNILGDTSYTDFGNVSFINPVNNGSDSDLTIESTESGIQQKGIAVLVESSDPYYITVQANSDTMINGKPSEDLMIKSSGFDPAYQVYNGVPGISDTPFTVVSNGLITSGTYYPVDHQINLDATDVPGNYTIEIVYTVAPI